MSWGDLGKTVEFGRIVDQDALECGVVSRALGKKIEQARIIRLVLLRLGRMWPVTAPYQPLRRCLDVGCRNGARVSVIRRALLARDIGTGQLHPGLAAIEQAADDLVGCALDARRLRHLGQVIKHQPPGQ